MVVHLSAEGQALLSVTWRTLGYGSEMLVRLGCARAVFFTVSMTGTVSLRCERAIDIGLASCGVAMTSTDHAPDLRGKYYSNKYTASADYATFDQDDTGIHLDRTYTRALSVETQSFPPCDANAANAKYQQVERKC